MSEKLKIYACSGIGNADVEYNYWLDNTNTACNTQAVNTLLSMINLNYSEVKNLNIPTSDVVSRLNKIDLLTVAMYYAQVYSNAPEDLHRAGQVIGCLLDKGTFDFDSLSNEERDRHLDELFEIVADVISDDTLKASQSFTEWWQRTVEDKNVVFLSKEQQDTIAKVLGKSGDGIGKAGDEWENNKDLAEYLNKASEYFLYTYFTDEQLKRLPQVFRSKKRVQEQTYDYCKAMYVGVYGSEDSMRNVIRAGIIDYFKATPEQVCEKIAGEKEGVGLLLTVAEIVSIIIACISAVTTILASILSCVAQIKVAQYQSIDTQAAQAATPNQDDFSGLDFSDGKKSSTMWLVAAVAALYLIFKK